MANLCFALCRLFGRSAHKDAEIKDLVKSLKDLIPLSEDSISLKVKIGLLERRIAELEGRRRHTLAGIM